jgi:SAM-dependent methyltransferase
VALAALPPRGRVLEIGCGPGQATEPLARRGYRMLCLELGSELAALARERCRDYPQVEIRCVGFEDWSRKPDESFDLVMAASAFHWIDPVVGYAKAAAALKGSGALCLFWNYHDPRDESVHRAIQKVYERVAPEMSRGRKSGSETATSYFTEARQEVDQRRRERGAAIERSGWFGPVTIREYPWSADYTAETYTQLLGTFSDHIVLADDVRRRLLAEVAETIDRHGGTVTRHHRTTLYVARKKM